MSKVLLPAQLTGVASRKDRSYSLKFETRELRGSEAATLLDLLQNEGWLLFSPNDNLAEVDIPDEKADAMMGTKTQAQRLRGVIFRVWEMKGSQGSFDQYYTSVMENVIDKFKEQLD
jgi:hypothetical protein